MQLRTALSALVALVMVLIEKRVYFRTVANVGLYNVVKRVASD